MELAKTVGRAMVIGGGSVYKQMLPYCDIAYITKVHTVTTRNGKQYCRNVTV